MQLTAKQMLELRGTDLVARMVAAIRPSREAPDAARNLEALTSQLKSSRRARRHFADTIRQLLAGIRMTAALDEGGILSNRGLLAGLRQLAGDALLHRVYPPNDLRALMHAVFPEANDWEWVAQVDAELWARLIDLVTEPTDAIGMPHEDVAAAIMALAQRIGSQGIDPEVLGMLSGADDADSPFLCISLKAHAFLEDHRRGRGTAKTYAAAHNCARDCRRSILKLRRDRDTLGTSLRLTALTRRVLQQLERFELLLRLVRPDNARALARSVAPLLANLLKAEQTAGSLRRLIRHHLDLLAYQVVEHTADKGEKYIARTGREYGAFLVAAMAGGAFVAAFAVFKLFLGKLDLPLAAQAFLYGLNYSVCFVLIYLSGAILATKAPATTGSTVARLIDAADGRGSQLSGVADLVTLIWRGQFVSFLGNVICAFPFAIAIAYLLELVFGVTTADPTKSAALLQANHPWKSATLFYAAVAGICLFIAGVIQGSVDNRIVYSRIRDRLLTHPRLSFLGSRREKLVDFGVRNASGILGNTALGFLLGAAGTIGTILGLPLDIRHIAFSTSHLGVAALDAPQLVDARMVGIVALGITGIGLVNFAVSFGLTMIVAFLSRGVSFAQSKDLMRTLMLRLLARPHHWFLPLGSYEIANGSLAGATGTGEGAAEPDPSL